MELQEHKRRVRKLTSPSGKREVRLGPLIKATPTTGHGKYPTKFLKEHNHGTISKARHNVRFKKF